MSNISDKEKYVLRYENLELYLRLGLKLNKMHCVLEFNQPQWLKPYIEFNTQKNRYRKKWRERWKNIVQINGQCFIPWNYWKHENVQLISNKRGCLKWTSKPSYILHKMLDNDLFAIPKRKHTFMLNKLAYVGLKPKMY